MEVTLTFVTVKSVTVKSVTVNSIIFVVHFDLFITA
jgi:hypothetical protein